MIYSHDTGEDRPLVEICDECDRYGSCEYDPSDCEADAEATDAEARWEAARDAHD